MLFRLVSKLFLKERVKYLGKKGENRVADILRSLPGNYYYFNDVYLMYGGHSVQIDHVVLSTFGIFVIETKNYSGIILGSEKSEQWVKNVYGHKYFFY